MADFSITNDLVSPTVNDVNGGVTGDGVNTDEDTAAPWRLGVEGNYVISGFVLPASSGTLTIDVPTGKAIVSGYYVTVPGNTTLTVTASSTNHVYLKLIRDGSNHVSSAVYEVNTTGIAPADSVKIGMAVASGSAITSSWQARRRTPQASHTWSGPNVIAAGSTRSHEADVVITANQNLSGVHFYHSFWLKSGVTLTVPDNDLALVIYSQTAILIEGTIDAASAGSSVGSKGTDQPGGGGGGGTVGGGGQSAVVRHGLELRVTAGGAISVAGSNGTQLSGAVAMLGFTPFGMMGGAHGGSGGVGDGPAPGDGGRGGGSIVLIAPVVILGGAAVFNTSGGAGTGGGTNAGGGGGGGAGNVYILTRHQGFTDNGATFTQTGGAGGVGSAANGGAGAAGVRQAMEYF